MVFLHLEQRFHHFRTRACVTEVETFGFLMSNEHCVPVFMIHEVGSSVWLRSLKIRQAISKIK